MVDIMLDQRKLGPLIVHRFPSRFSLCIRLYKLRIVMQHVDLKSALNFKVFIHKILYLKRKYRFRISVIDQLTCCTSFNQSDHRNLPITEVRINLT